jgi:hypothetical protein
LPGPQNAHVASFGLQTRTAAHLITRLTQTRSGPDASSLETRESAATRRARGTQRRQPPLLLPGRHARCTLSLPRSAPQTPCCRAASRTLRHPSASPLRRPRPPRLASSSCAAASTAAAAASIAGSSMGFSCAPPGVWPSPVSRGASCRGAIAAARGRVPSRGLQEERRRQRREPHRGSGTGELPQALWSVGWGDWGWDEEAGVRREAPAEAGAGARALAVRERAAQFAQSWSRSSRLSACQTDREPA